MNIKEFLTTNEQGTVDEILKRSMEGKIKVRQSLGENILDTIQSIGTELDNAVGQLGVGALQMAQSVSPVNYDGDTGLEPIVPTAISGFYRLADGVNQMFGGEEFDYSKKFEEDQAKQTDNARFLVKEVTGIDVPEPRNVADLTLNVLPNIVTGVGKLPVSGSKAVDLLQGALEYIVPFRVGASKSAVAVPTALTGVLGEGIDALSPEGSEQDKRYTRIDEVFDDEYYEAPQPIELNGAEIANLTEDGLPPQNDDEFFSKKGSTLAADVAEEFGAPDAVELTPAQKYERGLIGIEEFFELDKTPLPSDEEEDYRATTALAAAGTAIAGAALIRARRAFTQPAKPPDTSGLTGEKPSDKMKLNDTSTTKGKADALIDRVQETMQDRYARVPRLLKRAGATKQETDIVLRLQDVGVNSTASMQQIKHMFETGEMPFVNRRMKVSPKRTADALSAIYDTPEGADLRMVLMYKNIVREGKKAGLTDYKYTDANGNQVSIPLLTMERDIARALANPKVAMLNRQIEEQMKTFTEWMLDMGFITQKTAQDWLTNRSWYHPLAQKHADSSSSFFDTLLDEKEGNGAGRLLNHMLERGKGIQIQKGEFEDPIQSYISYMENIPRLVTANLWRRNIIELALKSSDPRVKELFVPINKGTKHMNLPTMTYIDRGVPKKVYVRDPDLHTLLKNRPDQIGSTLQFFDNMRQLYQMGTTGVLRLGAFSPLSAWYEGTVIGLTAPRGYKTGLIGEMLNRSGIPSLSRLGAAIPDPTMWFPMLNFISVFPVNIVRALYGRSMFNMYTAVQNSFSLDTPLSKAIRGLESQGVINRQQLARNLLSRYENSTYYAMSKNSLTHAGLTTNPTMNVQTLLRDLSPKLYKKMGRRQGSMAMRLADDLMSSMVDFGKMFSWAVDQATNSSRMQFVAANLRKGMSPDEYEELMYHARTTIGSTTKSGAGDDRGVLGAIGTGNRVFSNYWRTSVNALAAIANAISKDKTTFALRSAGMLSAYGGYIWMRTITDPEWADHYWNKMTPQDRALGIPDKNDVTGEWTLFNNEPILGVMLSPFIETFGAVFGVKDYWRQRDAAANEFLSTKFQFDTSDINYEELRAGSVFAASRISPVSVPSIANFGSSLLTGKTFDVGRFSHTGEVSKPVYEQSITPLGGRTVNSLMSAELETAFNQLLGTSSYAIISAAEQLTLDLGGKLPEPYRSDTSIEAVGKALKRFGYENLDGNPFGRDHRIKMANAVGTITASKKAALERLNELAQAGAIRPEQRAMGTKPFPEDSMINLNLPPHLKQPAVQAKLFLNALAPLIELRQSARKEMDLIRSRPDIFMNPGLLRKTENEIVEELRDIDASLYTKFLDFEENTLMGGTIEQLRDDVEEAIKASGP